MITHRKVATLYKAPIVVAGGGWWDLNGALDSCVAAYLGKGAASAAASYVNLANAGTYDLTLTGAPTWGTAVGWGGFSATAYLNTGIAVGQLWTMIVRHTNAAPGTTQFVCGSDSYKARRFYIAPSWVGGRTYGAGGYIVVSGDNHANGVSAVAGRQGYFDGSADGGQTSAAYIDDVEYAPIIGTNNLDKALYWKGAVQAVAFYNTELTVQNIADLTTVMAAL